MGGSAESVRFSGSFYCVLNGVVFGFHNLRFSGFRVHVVG